MIVTIDGPAGAGKSTVARALAKRLGFYFLDTGAMYRAVALAAVRHHVDWTDPGQMVALARRIEIHVGQDHVLLEGEDVTAEIRTAEITSLIYHAADNPGVREHLVELQRQASAGKDLVTEGRDQGTVVFPDAACKIFLTASPEERARRRQRDLEALGESMRVEEILAQQTLRDERDAARPCGPLAAAADAVEVVTDGLTLEEVAERLAELVNTRRS